jgi:prepilin-type N-terminal cleavage/methylation domain-containing protein
MTIRIKQHGFTILELMIASTVFSVVLLLCTIAIIQVGRMYYRGVVSSRTQESARAVIDDISQAIQFSGDDVNTAVASVGASQAFCVGQRRYTYRPTGASNPSAGKVLVVDELPSSNCLTGAPSAQNLVGPSVQGRDLLGQNMRVISMSVSPVGVGTQRLWRISVAVAYGDYTLTDPDSDGQLECPSLNLGGQFCAISDLTTVVQKRL